MRPEVFDALRGVELILHAGDVGGQSVLNELNALAPVRAVYGNTDLADDPSLQAAIDMVVDGLSIHVSHGHEIGAPTPERLLRTYPADIIIYGHTHKPLIERSGDRLIVNPGAAGPRRFKLRPSVGRLTIVEGKADAEVVWL